MGISYEITAAGHLRFVADKAARADLREILADRMRGYTGALDYLVDEVTGGTLEFLRPEEVGALTDAPIFGEDVERDDDGMVTAAGAVWWFPDYAVRDEMAELASKGEVVFTRAPTPAPASGMRQTIEDAAARAFFVSAWADFEEERGRTYPGCDLMDVAPEENHPAAVEAAAELMRRLEAANGATVEELWRRACAAEHPDDAEAAEAMADDGEQARLFGHYLGMQAMGHGVAWTDDHADPGITVPYMEFTSLHVERAWTAADNAAWAEVERRGKLAVVSVDGDGRAPFRGADAVDQQVLAAIEWLDEDGEVPDGDAVRALRRYLADKDIALVAVPAPRAESGLDVGAALRQAAAAEEAARRAASAPGSEPSPDAPSGPRR